ncbi:MAG: hypothetical protein ACYC1K_01605 [Minisyncoccota bacterium]
MKYIASSLLIGFIAISVWGFGVMGHEGSYMTDDCIASSVDKVTCPQGAITTAEHHMSAYQTFFLAIPLSPAVSLMLFITLFFIGFVFLKNFLHLNFFAHFLQLVRYRKKNPDLSLHQSRSVTAWLSLFELSPAL